jgi:hypothetical protein
MKAKLDGQALPPVSWCCSETNFDFSQTVVSNRRFFIGCPPLNFFESGKPLSEQIQDL